MSAHTGGEYRSSKNIKEDAVGLQRQIVKWADRLRTRCTRRVEGFMAPATIANSRSPRTAGKSVRWSTVEQLESRCLMAADPIQVGVVYIEEDLGSDIHGDTFYVTFQGGAPDTELTSLSIDGDLNGDGFGLGDLFFDTRPTGLGADHAFDFQVQRLESARPDASVQALVDDGSTRLTLQFQNFRAGDLLVFSIDVDEVQFFDPNETDLDRQNQNFDPITSGVEFQNSLLQASFAAPHYRAASGQTRFLNRYDAWLDASGLPLPADDHEGKRDRTAGGGFAVQQIPQPVSLAGTVFVDSNEDLQLQPNETPLGGVLLELYRWDGSAYLSTGHTAVTDALGRYAFSTDLDLPPGIYEVRETQPDGYYSVGATPGRLGSVSVGTVAANVPDVISRIELPLGDSHAVELNFAENLPSELQGHVCVVTAGKDCFDATAEKSPLAGVLIELFDAQGALVASQRTAADGTFRFTNLRAGNYTLVEHTPHGLLNGSARAGSTGGLVASPDRITNIALPGGTQAVEYAFCELEPSEISGRTWFDLDADGVREPGEPLLSGVQVTLWDAAGNRIAETSTDSNGFYRFTGLRPGSYRLTERTPDGFVPGAAVPGRVRGVPVGRNDASGDVIDGIVLDAGAVGIDYDFGETQQGSISGIVFADIDFDCIRDPGEQSLSDVEVQLLNASGQVLATTRTDANGAYRFDGLLPGNYTVREIQPDGFFHGGQRAPSSGGDASRPDIISDLALAAGQVIVGADFCEVPPAEISGYVFQDGPEIIVTSSLSPTDIRSIRDGRRTPDDVPIAGVTVQLRALNGLPLPSSVALPGTYASGTIEVQTDANGFFRFTGLRAGSYHIYEMHPSQFVDGLDTPGTTTGFAINPGDAVPLAILSLLQLSDPVADPGTDAILAVSVEPGGISMENNFSEIVVRRVDPPRPPDPPVPPLPPNPPEFPQRPLPTVEQFSTPAALRAAYPAWSPLPLYIGVGHIASRTWHLSVINGGFPRGMAWNHEVSPETVAAAARRLDAQSWKVAGMVDTAWHVVSTRGDYPLPPDSGVFYVPDARMLAGDFNGDGRDEVVLFADGEWFIDVNGNGRWDDGDIWARLGQQGDQPVVGDWDGDGKSDIGVFGPRWQGDDRAVAAETGLPEAQNMRRGKAKNIPPSRDEAPDDPRLLQFSKRGPARADLVDHVFELGGDEDTAIAGDFNGDGITTIGLFRDGRWMLDVDGDGQLTEARDRIFSLGQAGDLPLIGDFDGDGIDEIAVLRGHQVLVDSNGDGRLDVNDQVFQLDDTTGEIVVGDFDGDGRDEPAVIRPGGADRRLSARRAG
ncbi:MAG: hypothetical protein D6753_06555 [Planctomycetota bacterium]|nr:MAG: hypothetical protein D6753_06555 [Planctomycetota bacterium]